ncbi:SusE domain-containing protein [Wenyingzhuangia sp. IMCC45467]
MKKLIIIFIAFISLVGLNACSDDSSPIFVAQPSTEGISFTSSFAAKYLLSNATKENIADRIIWSAADFGVSTNISYELLAAIDVDADPYKIIGTTSETNYGITVDQLLSFAKDLGLDDDPTTTNTDGTPNNTGVVYLKVKASMGSTGTNEVVSEVQPINIEWIETVANDGGCPSLYAVGAGLDNIGWNFVPAGEMVCDGDVLQLKASFINENFRFFQESGDWASDLKYSYYEGEGYTIDANLEDAQDDANFKFIGTPGIYTLTIDNVNKTIVLTPSNSLWTVGGAVPGGWSFDAANTVEFIESTPDVWSASIALANEKFRFFTAFDDWNSGLNYSYYADQNFTIDAAFEDEGEGDGNFVFVGTPGTYTLTVNAVDKTITLE